MRGGGGTWVEKIEENLYGVYVLDMLNIRSQQVWPLRPGPEGITHTIIYVVDTHTHNHTLAWV